MGEPIDIKRICDLLPHRYPMILVDRVLDYKPFEYLTAIKNVTINENFFTGHFPENPIMPGVLMLEALAQACGLLSGLSQSPEENKGILHFFAGIDNARFRRVVIPGDQLKLDVTITKIKSNVLKVNAIASVDGEEACSAEIMSIRSKVEK